MLQKANRDKVLNIFYEYPLTQGFQLREISRLIDLAPTSVKKYLAEFEKENLIIKKKHRVNNYPLYYANRDNKYFRFLKSLENLKKINESGLLTKIYDECMPGVIILFGSAAKGEDTKESDIDIYVQCKNVELNLTRFEKKLNRKVNILFNESFLELSKELKNNIINGIILKGYLKVY